MALAFGSQRSFDDLGTPLFDVTFCVLDIETTGSGPESLGITEIGAVKVRCGEVVGTFQTLVNPCAPIPPTITVLTGITQSMVIGAPTLEQVIPPFLEFLGDSVVVGHNVRFDLGFLNAAAARFGYGQIPNPSVDTLALARRLIRTEVRNLRLGTLASYFRSPVTPDHRALADAQATSHVLHALLERAGTLGVTALEDLLQLPRAKGSPHYGKLRMARDLPRVPGVYLFYDRDGEVIYVGKAKNLRTRVSSYFYGDERRSIGDLLRRLEEIDYIECSGDLEASITEQRLIHAHRPVFNRVNRPPKANHFVSLTVEAFPRLSLTRSINHRSALVLGPFRSQQQARLIQAALWDATKVRRCSGEPGSKSAPCASAQLGFSFCPCTGELIQDDYVSVIAQIVDGVETDATLLLDPLTDRIRQHAAHLRYEEAGWVRDRYRALALAIDRRHQWHAMVDAGRFEAEHPDGECAVVDSGRLLVSWNIDSNRPLIPVPVQEPKQVVPPDVAAAEEARIIWKWMTQPGILIAGGSGPLSPPEVPMIEQL